MKKLTLALGMCALTSMNLSYAQVRPNITTKKDFLRNYQASDFKLRRLDVTADFGTNGYSQVNDDFFTFGERSGISYFQFSNQAKYQGNFHIGLTSHFNYINNNSEKSISNDVTLDSRTMNYFFFKNKWFIGIHNQAQIAHAYSKNPTNAVGRGWYLESYPMASIGYGRLEPVQYARNAMDIENQLRIGGRLDHELSENELDRLADKLAVINNVRYYDFRLRRIEIFEEIDRQLDQMGAVTAHDVTYFAHLADAYLYAQNFSRSSGFRHEFGLLGKFSNALASVEAGDYSRLNNGGFVAYNFRYDIPASYTVQHTFTAAAIGGMSTLRTEGIGAPAIVENQGEAWANISYRLGLYPTTRTYFSLEAKVGNYLLDYGYSADLSTTGQIYFSPRFRMEYNLGVAYGEGYQNHVFQYLAPGAQTVGDERFSFFGGLNFRYAIF